MPNIRTEHDFLGQLDVPADAYWGIHTQRAVNNFPVSGLKVNPRLIESIALIKKACCLANYETGYLDAEKAHAIMSACDERLPKGGMPCNFLLMPCRAVRERRQI